MAGLVLRLLAAVWALGVAVKLGVPGPLPLVAAVLVLLGNRWVRPVLVAVRAVRP